MASKRKRAASSVDDGSSKLLCGVCTSMTGTQRGLESLVSADGYKHHSRSDLELSALCGCPCCKMLLSIAKEQWTDSTDWDPRIEALNDRGMLITARTGKFAFEEQKLSLLRYKKSMENDTVVCNLWISAAKGNPASGYISNESVTTDVGSTHVSKRAKEQLAECEGHEMCLGRTSAVLPTRIIFVGQSSGDVKLYKSKTEEKGEYVALSYCWGGQQAVTTTQETVGRYTHGLDVSTLPRTFQDAIHTSRRLGFEYLWVDALCIIQDSDEDRSREIIRMGDIYKNAALTIVAANNNTVTAGFLNSRPSPHVCWLPLFTPNGGMGAISLVPKVYGAQPKEPLYTRAWTLQEFLLSPRLLIFGEHEAVWQCDELITPVLPSHRSYDPNWPCKRISSISNKFKIGSTSTDLTSKPDEMTVRYRRNIWQSIVNDYTSRNLTMPEDRLPALAGIARELESCWHDTYVGGMWRSELLCWLLWRSERKTQVQNEIRPTIWKAPSWSWASTDGIVTFHWTGGTKPSAKVVHIDIEPREYGPVGGKHMGQQLVLKAITVPLKDLPEIREGYRKLSPSGRIRDGDDGEIEDDGTLKFVLLGFNYLSAFGLIVRPNIGSFELGTFSRVGMICTWLPKEPSWWAAKKTRVVIE